MTTESYIIKAKAGAILRDGCELSTAQVGELPSGASVTVLQRSKTTCKKRAARCRVVAAECGVEGGVEGWLSEKCLAPAPAAAAAPAAAPAEKPVVSVPG